MKTARKTTRLLIKLRIRSSKGDLCGCPPTFFDLFGHRCARLAAAMLNITLDKTDSAETPVEEELILAVFDTIKYKYEQF